jgi:RNA polymerase sigma-70 factor (ECF subfamily)
MDETSESLLDRVRHGSGDDAWQRLVDCYTPFLRAILLRRGIGSGDVDDVIQNVLAVVVRRIPEFERQRTGSFRTWLRGICANCFREFWRNKGKQAQLKVDANFADAVAELSDGQSDLSRYWDREHDDFLLGELLKVVRAEFRESTYEAFRRLALGGESVDSVARDLGISVNAAFVARSRVLKRLREVGAGMID